MTNITEIAALLTLAEVTMLRYDHVDAKQRLHPPDFDAAMKRACANVARIRGDK